MLTEARPNYGWLGEETGGSDGKDPTRRWIVDPIDGTTNFLHGLPHWSVSIALEYKGEIVAGVVLRSGEGRDVHIGEGRRRLDERPTPAGFRAARGLGNDLRHRYPVRHHGYPARDLHGALEADAALGRCPALGCGRRSISPMSRQAGSTGSGSAACIPGTSPRVSCWFARQADWSGQSVKRSRQPIRSPTEMSSRHRPKPTAFSASFCRNPFCNVVQVTREQTTARGSKNSMICRVEVAHALGLRPRNYSYLLGFCHSSPYSRRNKDYRARA